MTIPSYQSLMLPVLQHAAKAETRVPAVAEKIADDLMLSESERSAMLKTGKQKILHNRVHWAKFYMSKAGLVESPKKGVFKATPAGLSLLATSPSTINVQTLKQYPSFNEFYSPVNSAKTVSKETEGAATLAVTPEEAIGDAQVVLHAALRADLLQRILDNDPSFFERLIIDLLVAMGYGGSHENAAVALGKTGDGGIDGIVDEDRLGLDRIYVQAKRYAQHVTIGAPELMGFVGSLVGRAASKGVFVTTSSFTPKAVQYVGPLPQRVVLIDGSRLTELMIEHDVGVRLSRAIAIKRIDDDYFSDN